MADDIKIVSNSGKESSASPLRGGAEFLAPGLGDHRAPSALAQKYLLQGDGDLVAPNRADRQLKGLVGPRKIIGRDDRIRVTKTNDHPWRMICQLVIESKSGQISFGTGWLASSRTVITAGHCVYDPSALKGWATSITVIPGRNDDREPFGRSLSTQLSSTESWIKNQTPEFDIAAIHLPRPIDPSLGWFGVAALPDEELKSRLLNISGYPDDKGNLQQWHDRNKVAMLDQHRVWYLADTERGQSGSPVFIFPEGLDHPPVVIGVHAYGATAEEQKNSATRITGQLAGVVRRWILESAVDRTETIAVAKPATRVARRIVYIPGEATQPKNASDRKKHWDEVLFGHSLGSRSTLFHYAKEIPELDIPVRPDEPTMDAVGDALEKDVGKGAAAFARAIGDAVIDTEENPLLFGLEQSIRWLGLSARYFLGSGGLYRDRVAQEFASSIASPEEEEILLITHGFGSVVAYDLLTTYRDTLPTQFGVRNVVTLASPLGYTPFAEKFGQFVFPQALSAWLDVAIKEDPLACDVRLFPADENRYQFVPQRQVVARAVEEFFADAYLKLSVTKSFVMRHLPPSFGTPVTDFFVASDVADELADTQKRMDVLIELDGKVGPDDSLDRRGRHVVEVLRELAEGRQQRADGPDGQYGKDKLEQELAIDLMSRYVAARLLPQELRQFELICQRDQQRGKPKVHHVWRNAEVRCLTASSVRVVQVDAARTAYAAYGEGIQWAVLDTGVDAEHPHFKKHGNIVEKLDFTRPNVRFRTRDFQHIDPVVGDAKHDRYGHGTHVAGIIGGQFDRWCGIAPRTRLHCYKVIDDEGVGRESSTIRALEYIHQLNASSYGQKIHGVNLSIGSSFDPTVYACGHSPMCKEVRRLWEQGVVVCIAAGNAGLVDFDPAGVEHLTVNLALSIGDPANVEEAIAVGSVHKSNPHSFGISYFSSRGPTADGRLKPDCVAPGEKVESASAGDRGSNLYRQDSGTSIACPHVSGLIAAFLSVRREFIGQPDEVKRILLENCTNIRRDRYHQGAGVPNLMKMLSST